LLRERTSHHKPTPFTRRPSSGGRAALSTMRLSLLVNDPDPGGGGGQMGYTTG
jgi:hypothetical protein